MNPGLVHLAIGQSDLGTNDYGLATIAFRQHFSLDLSNADRSLSERNPALPAPNYPQVYTLTCVKLLEPVALN